MGKGSDRGGVRGDGGGLKDVRGCADDFGEEGAAKGRALERVGGGK